jgi:ABC-type lipoprotein release transport system permease subunit
MLSSHAVRYFFALESVSYMLALWAWWRVWREPKRNQLEFAAICTCSGFGVKLIRVALIVMLSTSAT